ncbi:hypothetical protein [Moraxella sp. RCAD0137]|uniref:hypothetical protein n=1 Tax=Moraxella sp. RCAD0137 TaxID=1775913 RepID=UPI0011AED0CD|nr:hypothetical protein [Moraxella sp. RCAD0137]
MKILIMLTSILLITGCLPRAMQPPPQGYKSYQSRHPRINVEQIKRDMTECGFPDVNNVSSHFVHNHDGYVASNLCMEHKGYKEGSLPRGVCHRYPDSSPCQARQSNNPK